MARPPLNLIAQVTSLDSGQVETYSPASQDPRRVPQEMEFSTKSGTGHEGGSFTLARFGDYADERLRQVQFIGAGGCVAHEGRVSGRPETSGAGMTIQTTGFYSHLKDQLMPATVYIDQDMSHWGQCSLLRRAFLATVPCDLGRISWANENGLTLAFPNEALPASYTFAGAWYEAPPGSVIKEVVYQIKNTNYPGTWRALTLSCDDQDTTAMANDYALTADDTERTRTLTTARRLVELNAFSNAGAATPAIGANSWVKTLAAYGDHGLTTITASAVIEHVLATACPLLTYDDDSIATTTTEIAQLIAEPGGRAEDVILKCNGLHLYDIGVWDDRKFHFQPSPSLDDYDYELSLYDGDTLERAGEQVDDDGPFNGCWVMYQDVANGNREEIIGPYGTAAPLDPNGSDLLRDDTETNPCNREGMLRHAVLRINFPTTEANAIVFGAVFLLDKLQPNRQGKGRASGYVRNRAGAWVPAYQVRADKRVKYKHSDAIYRVSGTNYTSSDRGLELTYGQLADTVDALFERIGIALVEVKG